MANKLLPKTVDEFADENYWKKFFAERGADNSFEWYGDYNELKSTLQRYIKPSDKILQVGCGNSLLADQLYDNGYHSITSIDVVDDVVKNQRKRNRKKRPELVFQQADVTKLTYDDDSFNVVLDKGTLDALLPDESTLHVETVQKMFEEIKRCLTSGGRYLIISLVQEIVLKQWANYFSEKSFLLRLHQIPNKIQSKYQIFILIATKLKPGVSIPRLYELIYGSLNPSRFNKLDDLVDAVKSIQQYGYFCHRASANFLDEELHIQLYSSTDSSTPRYDVCIVQKKDNPKLGLPYAVFIVPQGRETHWHFTSEKGRQEVCKAAECRRLAIISLCRAQTFESLNQVKSELNGVVLDFAPDFLKNTSDVLYLSLGDDYLGERSVKQTYSSPINGEFVVEDVFSRDSNETLRRLVFLSNQNVVQSEIQMVKNEKDDEKLCLDWNNLSCLHHRAIVASLAMCCDNFIEANLKICLIGIGGGCLATFLRKHFFNATLIAVELDPIVVEAAKNWFEFVPDEKLQCVVEDGVEFLKRSAVGGDSFDVIIFDVGGSYHIDGLSGPPPSFLTDECLNYAKTLLMPNGALAINLICRDAEKSADIESNVSKVFDTVMSHSIADMVNHLLICLPYKPADLTAYNQTVQTRLSKLYEYLAEICKTEPRLTETEDDKVDNGPTSDLNHMFEKIVNL